MRLRTPRSNTDLISLTGNGESHRGSPDDQFINVHDADELRHWAHLLNMTTDRLKEVVAKAGSSADGVRKYLRRYCPNKPVG